VTDDSETCFDEKIKNYYKTVGYILLCFPLFVVMIAVMIGTALSEDNVSLYVIKKKRKKM
jgi:hypothetical protein